MSTYGVFLFVQKCVPYTIEKKFGNMRQYVDKEERGYVKSRFAHRPTFL